MSPTETFDILMYYIMHYINSMHTKSKSEQTIADQTTVTMKQMQWDKCSTTQISHCL